MTLYYTVQLDVSVEQYVDIDGESRTGQKKTLLTKSLSYNDESTKDVVSDTEHAVTDTASNIEYDFTGHDYQLVILKNKGDNDIKVTTVTASGGSGSGGHSFYMRSGEVCILPYVFCESYIIVQSKNSGEESTIRAIVVNKVA